MIKGEVIGHGIWLDMQVDGDGKIKMSQGIWLGQRVPCLTEFVLGNELHVNTHEDWIGEYHMINYMWRCWAKFKHTGIEVDSNPSQ